MTTAWFAAEIAKSNAERNAQHYADEKERLRQEHEHRKTTTEWMEHWTPKGIVRMSEYRGLTTVLIDTGKLLARVEENLTNHRQRFEEAVEGYKLKTIEILEDHIERILNNAPERVVVALDWPEDHSSDYERVIEQLKWSKDAVLELNEQEFAMYVLDQWGWQAGFSKTYAMYSSSE